MSTQQNVEVALLVLRNGTGIAQAVDAQPYVDQAFDLALSNRSQRASAYVLIGQYAHDKQYPQHNRSAALIDKVGALIESAEPADFAPLPALLHVLANDGRNDLKAHWVKMMNKIAQTCFRLMNKYRNSDQQTVTAADMEYYAFYLSVVRAFLASELRSLWTSYVPTLREVAAYPLFQTAVSLTAKQAALAAEVFGLALALAAPEQWVATWSQLVAEARNLLYALAVPVSSAQPISKHVAQAIQGQQGQPDAQVWGLNLEVSRKKKNVKGVTRALCFRRWAQRVCLLLTQMLECGSVHIAPVGLPLKPLLDAVKDVLGLVHRPSLDLQSNYVENDQGLSPVDLAFVLDEVKVALLSVVTALMRTHCSSAATLSLARSARAILTPLVKCLHSFTAPAFSEAPVAPALLRCLQAAALAFPHALAEALTAYESLQSGRAQGNDAVQVFAAEMGRLTLNTSSLSDLQAAASSSAKGGSALGKRPAADAVSGDSAVTLEVLALTKTLLSHCAHYLSPASRSEISRAVRCGLTSLERGMSWSHNPHIVKEGLRQNAGVIRAFLDVAHTEVLAGSSAGVFSSNIFPLQTLSAALLQVATDELGSQAATILLAVGHILQPSQLVLPAFPAHDVAQQHLANALAAAQQAQVKAAASAVAAGSDALVAPVTATEQSVNLVRDDQAMLESIGLRGATDSAKPIKISTTKAAAKATPAKATPKTAPTKPTPANVKTPAGKKPAAPATKTAEESDDDLPELDVGSDPEA